MLWLPVRNEVVLETSARYTRGVVLTDVVIRGFELRRLRGQWFFENK